MKQIVRLSSVINEEPLTRDIRVLSLRSPRKKKKPFVVINTTKVEDGNTFLLTLLKRHIKEFGLEQAPGHLRSSSLKKIQHGDIIIFGDTRYEEDYDYIVEDDVNIVDEIDGRRFEVYDILIDFERILARLTDFVSYNQVDYVPDYCYSRPAYHSYCTPRYYKPRKIRKPKKTVRVRVNFNDLHCDDESCYVKKKDYSFRSPVCSSYTPSYLGYDINADFVVMGMEQYEIKKHRLTGNEFIQLKNGDKLRIKRNRYGKKYLSK